MAQQTLNDGVSFGEQRSKINSNFTELYSTKTTNTNAAITGGTINGAVIGGTTPAAGSFTTLSAGGLSVAGLIRSGAGAASPTGGIAHCTPAGVEAVLELYQVGIESWKIKNLANSSDLVFANSGSERLRLSGSGNLSVAGSGAFGGNVSATGRLSTAGITEDASGNLCLGVTPSAWSNYKSIQFGYSGALSNHVGLNYLRLESNSFNGGSGEAYLQNGHATKYAQNSGAGVHAWYSAPYGTAGDLISFTQAMTLDASGSLTPGSNGAGKLGTTSLRWGELWVTTGAFNTSDARQKTEVVDFSPDEIKAAKMLSKEIGIYKWLKSVEDKGEGARKHIGLTVQRAIAILEECNLDPWSYAFIAYDKWDDEFVNHPAIEAVQAKDAVLDEDGNLLEPAIEAIEAKDAWVEKVKEAGDAYAFRYDQLNLFIARGIEARLFALEDKLN